MTQLLVGFLVGFCVSLLTTPLAIVLAKHFGLVDNPTTHQHPAIVHQGIIPRAGGLPIYLGIVASYFAITQHFSKQTIGILAGAFLIVITGLLDDRFDLSPYIRFFVNIIIALIVVGFGVGIGFITSPFGGVIHLNQIVLHLQFLGGAHSIIVIADIFAILWIIWMMNAINWSSGVDGQLPGIVAIGAIVLGVVAYRFSQVDPGQIPVVFLAVATAAAFIGFIPFSFYPQKIMPGYGGAALGGYLLAVLAILSGAKLATALIVLAVPMTDGLLAIVRRVSRRQSPFRGDREHFHHHLLELGWSKRSIALFYWLTCAMLGVIALQLDSKGKLFALLAFAVVFGGIIYWIYRSRERLEANV